MTNAHPRGEHDPPDEHAEGLGAARGPPRPTGEAIPDVVEVAIDGVLDLHVFSPRDLGTLIPDYLIECQRRGILAVRLIHGRGIGAVQRSVHALLARSPLVRAYRLADSDAGGRGATFVDLHPTSPPPD